MARLVTGECRPASRSVTSPSPLADTLQRALGAQYRVERELGGGGMSRIFLAHDLGLDREVVVKVLSSEATEGVSADRFRREIQLIARLQHPHVVPILSAGSADGSLYYVMPFVAGETLRERLAREGTLPIADVVRLLRELLDALAFAHDHGVVHRDIKPENVLLASGHAVVADFGIAKALRESGTLTSAGFALGTPAYMAPEQATADPATDHRADLYSIGVLGYELLTGAPPFAGTPQQVITQHLTTPAAPISSRRADIPAALADTITRALAKDPAERPQTAREMIVALEGVTAPASPPTRAPGARSVGSARRFVPPRLGLVLTAGFVVALAAAGTLTWRARAHTDDASTTAPVAAGADLIAVMPLSAVSDTSLARLGQDLVVTLSANLDGVGSLHTVDAVTLLMRARKAPSPLPLADARRLARDLGARSVLTGTLLRAGDRVRAAVTLHGVGGDSMIASATALASPSDIAAITDSLTWGILQQVWRRGTAPSPVLAGLTTRSVEALRAFLDGERHFQRLDPEKALAEYRRAFELDSNFAQAYLRYGGVNGWTGAPPDTMVNRRLAALAHRLPEREQLFLSTARLRLPVPEHIARWKELAKRYPDYPPILMATADPIVHNGPYYGIPIAEAKPMLDRLEELVPEHGDTRFHQAIVALSIGTDDSITLVTANAARVMDAPWGPALALAARQYEARARGTPLPPVDAALPTARALAAVSRGNVPYYATLATLGVEPDFAGYRLRALERIRALGIYSGDLDLASTLSEGSLRISRGDWAGGLRALRRTESSSLPFADRMTSARLATLGAWLGAVDTAAADSALRRVRTLPGADVVPPDRAELRWLDGLLGVMHGDAARVQRARQELAADTSRRARNAARSLAGLWLFRTDHDAGADTLRASSDDAMRTGGPLLSVMAIDRLVIGRALRKRGAPAEAERYLMWPDAATNSVRNSTVHAALGALVSYERGVALEEAGDRHAAAYRLRRFVNRYDQPPAAHRALVEDAKRRLAQLEKTDTPVRTVTPR
jgi:TolB-like protein